MMVIHASDRSECRYVMTGPSGYPIIGCPERHHILVEPVTEFEQKMVEHWNENFGVPNYADIQRYRDERAMLETFGGMFG